MANRPFDQRAAARPGFGDAPVGAVSAYAGPVGVEQGARPSPIEGSGWMLCDGRALEVSNYPELFAVLGYLYGGHGEIFNIPDYRGAFLRGADLGSGQDPDAMARMPAIGGRDGGVGSTQQSALQDHAHLYNGPAGSDGLQPGGIGEMPRPGLLTGGPVSEGSSDPVRVSRSETRPANIAVNYIIKFSSRLG